MLEIPIMLSSIKMDVFFQSVIPDIDQIYHELHIVKIDRFSDMQFNISILFILDGHL